MDASVEDDEDAEVADGGGDLERVVEVAGAVAVAGAEGTLGAGQDDRAGVGVVEVEEEGRLLQGVGAVGDHDAVDAGVGEGLLDGAQEGELVGRGHAGAVHVEQVDDLDGDALGEGGGGEDVVTGGVGGVAGALPAAGDRATGADHDDPARSPVVRPLHACRPYSVPNSPCAAKIGRRRARRLRNQLQKCFIVVDSCAMDRIDLHILRELQNDGRLSNQELAQRVGLSPSPVCAGCASWSRTG